MVMQYVNMGWDAYKRNFGTVVVGSLIPGLAALFILLVAALMAGLGALSLLQTNPLAALVSGAALFLPGLAVAFVVSNALSAGLIKVFVDSLSGESQIETMFSTAGQKFKPAAGAALLAALIILAAFGAAAGIFLLSYVLASAALLFIVLGLAAMLTSVLSLPLFIFVLHAVVIDNLGAVAAVKKSIEVAKRNYFGAWLLGIVYIVSSLAVGIIPLLGVFLDLLLVSPVFGLAFTAFYLGKR